MKDYNAQYSSWSVILKRLNNTPLDGSSVFDNLADYQNYIDNKQDVPAYVGQFCAVLEASHAGLYYTVTVGDGVSTPGTYKRLAFSDEVAGSVFNWQDDNITSVEQLLAITDMESGYAYSYNAASGTIPAANMATSTATDVTQGDIIICVSGMGDGEPKNTFIVISTGISQEQLDELKSQFSNVVKIDVAATGTYVSEQDWYQNAISQADIVLLRQVYADVTAAKSSYKSTNLVAVFAANANDQLFKAEDQDSLIKTTGFTANAIVSADTLDSIEAQEYNRALSFEFNKGNYTWFLKIMFNSSSTTKSCVTSKYVAYK